ncbi:MAG: tRNA preQ1(34) S-adenosylmethionine ribosyltransferase-isomerase QueA [Armatimonadetes bacterium]|nr:tRNA preQ1(34) S-adenosylmethionine ribosyltransferase-isomerase QueA [Armatimonadota bacterium]
MRIDELDYDLPEGLIAQEPLADRSASRMLRLDKETGEVRHLIFRNLLDELRAGDLLVLNNTRVSALRLMGRKETGGEVEAMLLTEEENGLFSCLLKPGKRLRAGTRVLFSDGLSGVCQAESDGPLRKLQLEGRDWRKHLAEQGRTPLPPYVHTMLQDQERYQTVYSARPGSAAAPTAGLHFTPGILTALAEKGIRTTYVTLDVSLDTFRPVQSETVEGHTIHGEQCELTEAAAASINGCSGRVVAVGTTSVRTIESFSQGRRQVSPGQMKTTIYITPGYTFKNVDAILTNFHMPRTTMLAMLSAFTRKEYLIEAYRQAIVEKYRFLSFGDAMLLA